MCCCLNDGQKDKENASFQAGWNGFLRLYNFYQFLPCSYFITTDGVEHKVYDGLKFYDAPVSAPGESEESGDGTQGNVWNEAKEYTDAIYHALLDKLKENNWPVPELGYELEGNGNGVVACAEMGWEALKLAFLTDEEMADERQFRDAGWKTVPIQDVLADPDKYMALKENSGE